MSFYPKTNPVSPSLDDICRDYFLKVIDFFTYFDELLDDRVQVFCADFCTKIMGLFSADRGSPEDLQ